MQRTHWTVCLAVSLTMIALGLSLGLAYWRDYRRAAAQHAYLDALLQRRQFVVLLRKKRVAFAPRSWWKRNRQRVMEWLESPLGQQLVGPEDRILMVQCGIHTVRGSIYLLAVRLGLVVFLPLLALAWAPPVWARQPWLSTLALMALGYLLPKWGMRRIAAKRRIHAEQELPLLVDLLGLLQGSGQGVDQSLQIIASDFQPVLPVLSQELGLANRLYASGRTREQAFNRMSDMFRSSNLADLTALLVQIDRHGGAVQEPLRQFGARLREARRMQMKESIGKVTVKMTGVMVLTLLPALMVVTAGPGFLAMSRALGGMK